VLAALLHDKLARDLARSPFEIEDLLTSTVFGACEYVPPERALLPFLRAARWPDGAGLADWLADGTTAKLRFWESWESLGATVPGAEPEVVVDLRRPDGGVGWLVVEAKLLSGKSSRRDGGPGIRDQLAKYWAHLRRRAVHVGATPLGILYVTAGATPPREEFKDSQRDLAAHGEPPAPLGWLSWRHFEATVDAGGCLLLRDVVRLLRDRWALMLPQPPKAWASPPVRPPVRSRLSIIWPAGRRATTRDGVRAWRWVSPPTPRPPCPFLDEEAT